MDQVLCRILLLNQTWQTALWPISTAPAASDGVKLWSRAEATLAVKSYDFKRTGTMEATNITAQIHLTSNIIRVQIIKPNRGESWSVCKYLCNLAVDHF